MHTLQSSRLFFWAKTAIVLLALGGLFGCSTAPIYLEPAQKSQIKRVGVISLLPSSMPVSKIGITVFNNETKMLPVENRFNEAARKGTEDALRNSGKEVIQVEVDAQAMAKKIRSAAIIFNSRAEMIEAELLEIIKKNKLDAVALVLEDFDYENGINGIWLHLRAGMGDIRHVAAKPDFSTLLVGPDTKILLSRRMYGWFPINRPKGMWTYNLEESLDKATTDHITSTFITHIEQASASNIRQMDLR
jgi:hypothetical protein